MLYGMFSFVLLFIYRLNFPRVASIFH